MRQLNSLALAETLEVFDFDIVKQSHARPPPKINFSRDFKNQNTRQNTALR